MLMVDECAICELKAIEGLLPVHTPQLHRDLKFPGKRLGFLINFNVPVIFKVPRKLFYNPLYLRDLVVDS
jgi:GxxExxY protein